MFKKYRQRRRIVESLESRQLLTACNIPFEEMLPGDANMDCYYDEADILQMFKAGKFNTGEAAVWEEGDFDGNGVFDGTDFELAAQNGNLVRYRFTRVPYDERATEPTNTLQPISTDGSADTTLYYFSATGQLYV
ncbi:MAG: hypothetical protein KDA87_06680, partial [Planctomycetales bacterium]|nr:hypothetical protein [Planctomycetales bacterium]